MSSGSSSGNASSPSLSVGQINVSSLQFLDILTFEFLVLGVSGGELKKAPRVGINPLPPGTSCWKLG
ncbi:hypothetical protein DPMN_194443 [Dreissena polymorpha]|uniref:Uncharacterized protein n=1 Tax=Dreissena polymorpha TaxID=45954 RepID=A0A9D3Y079_DREPO|nr:hypothetical protein DPMN_194443 [Dreissena polymorpha]